MIGNFMEFPDIPVGQIFIRRKGANDDWRFYSLACGTLEISDNHDVCLNLGPWRYNSPCSKDDCLEALEKNKEANILRLDLRRFKNRLIDEDIMPLKAMHSLQELYISSKLFSGKTFLEFDVMYNIKTLMLCYCNINIDTLLQLPEIFPNMERLGLIDSLILQPGDGRFLNKYSTLRDLNLNGFDVNTCILETLSDLPQLESLSLIHTDINDSDIEIISGYQQLKTLNLGGTSITDYGAKHLSKLHTLIDLELWETRITDNTLMNLKNLPNLMSLCISETAVTDDRAVILSDYPSLADLTCDTTLIGDKTIHELCRNKQMRSMALAYTTVSDRGFRNLRDMTSLQEIDVSKTEVTNQFLDLLYNLPNIRSIDISNTLINKIINRFIAPEKIEDMNLDDIAINKDRYLLFSDFSALKTLSINGSALTGSEIAEISISPDLARLYIREATINQVCYDDFVGFKNLLTLDMLHANIRDTGFDLLRIFEILPQCEIFGPFEKTLKGPSFLEREPVLSSD